jgi:hypothetical protein
VVVKKDEAATARLALLSGIRARSFPIRISILALQSFQKSARLLAHLARLRLANSL